MGMLSEVGRAERSARIWDRYALGGSFGRIALDVGCSKDVVTATIVPVGGIRPRVVARSARLLSLAEREEISRGLAAGESLRAIARGLGRSASTVSREVAGNGGRDGYRALEADRAARVRARRPKRCRLACSPRLRRLVEAKLKAKWSPEEIAGWLAREFPDRPEMRVSHETIYKTLFIQSRGALRRELHHELRSGRAIRHPKGTSLHRGQGRGQLTNTLHISERPAEAEDRAVPGHWEGDLVYGKGMTAIATLVERWSRFVLLVQLPEGNSSDAVIAALSKHVRKLPVELRRSLTWDQGKEMAKHVQFTLDTGLQVYFCDPRSPWQRGSNENTNGLLRQYFPRREADFKTYTQTDLNKVARELNGRPRKTLEFYSPAEKFAEAVASTR